MAIRGASHEITNNARGWRREARTTPEESTDDARQAGHSKAHGPSHRALLRDEEAAGSNLATLTGNRHVVDLAHHLRCWRPVSAAVTSTSPPGAAKAPENTARYACESLPGRSGALMAEGLNPIETGKKLHEHGEAAHHRAEGEGGHGGSDDRHSRVVQICEAVLLALVTITAAWAGYSAAKWSTASRVDIARASTLGNLATRDDLDRHSRSAISTPRPSTHGSPRSP